MQNGQECINNIKETKSESHCQFIFRMMALTWLVTHWLLSCYDSGYPDCFFNILKYLTCWGMQLTIAYFAWSVFFSQNQTENSYYFSAFNQIVFVNNFSISVFYYAFLYESVPLDLTQYIGIVNHSMPFLLVLIDTAINQSLFLWKNYLKYILLVGLYFVFNLSFTLLDEPIYPMIDYKSFHTAIYILLFFVLSFFGHAISMGFKAIFGSKSTNDTEEDTLGKTLESSIQDTHEVNLEERSNENA